jgi:hypothetical protein
VLILSLSSSPPRVARFLRRIRCFGPDPAYFKRERFGNRLGGVGVVVYAVVWVLLILSTGICGGDCVARDAELRPCHA